ncbi:tripartite motif-containing protein 45-like isoform X2 [Mercenaria mercenaria]|uniref:tripartite motif-containing protein 45-like isoform X2 n=1 Tax=Mercenaria mercenaria TaxID=6596 RepID=UPI00234F3C7F|nr:tripartite motif-containing protein 45-like isoform X2 [Mercenaria mercenaria]
METAEEEHGSDFEETMFCEPCNKEGNTVEADGFCSNCSDYLCSTCLKYHTRLAKDHTLFDKSSMPQDFCLERCVFHPNDLVKFYCTKCDNTACSQCIPIEHQTECSEFKHIPSYMQLQDVYRELKEVKKSLKAVEEEASRTGDESGQKLKKASLNCSDISKSISLQKKYIKDKIEEQRIEIFKALDDERVEVIRKLDERQGRRKEQLFEQQKLINSKIDDEANHLDEQLMLYPRKIQNIVLNSANIRSKLEFLTTELVNKERQGRKAELFVATKRTKENMKTLQKDIDDVCKENKVRCFTFRRNTENISIDAAENATLGSLIEESEQGDRDTTNGQQGTFNSASSTDTRIFAQNNIAVEEVQRDVTSEKIKRPDVCGRAEDPEFAIQRVATAVNAAGQAYITAKAVFKTWQDKQEVKQKQQEARAAIPKTQPKGWKPAGTQYTPPKKNEFKPPQSEYKPPQSERTPRKSDFKVAQDDWKSQTDDYKPPQSNWKSPAQSEPAPPKDQWKSPAEVGPMARLLEMGFFDTDLNKKLLTKHNDNLDKVVQELLSMKNKDWFI